MINYKVGNNQTHIEENVVYRKINRFYKSCVAMYHVTFSLIVDIKKIGEIKDYCLDFAIKKPQNLHFLTHKSHNVKIIIN